MGFDLRKEAKFLSTHMDDKTAASVGLANMMVLGATLAHDGDHFYQAFRWKYKIPLQLLAINLAVYVMPAISTFLTKTSVPRRHGSSWPRASSPAPHF